MAEKVWEHKNGEKVVEDLFSGGTARIKRNRFQKMEGVREMVSIDYFYKSFPKDEFINWKFFEKEFIP